MLAALIQRLRTVTPIVSALIAASLVVAAFIAPTAAQGKTLHFRFSGDAADFINYSVNPAFFDCFSGFLDPAGETNIQSSLRACIAPGFTAANANVSAVVARWSVQANHSNSDGHVITDSHLANNIEVNFVTPVNNTVITPLVQADDVHETAEAECQSDNGKTTHANARSKVSVVDLRILRDGNNRKYDDAIVKAANNHSLVITRQVIVPVLGSVTLIVTTNEHVVFQSGGHVAISANGLRVIVQDGDGDILVDVAVAHAHANIQCAFHSFSFEDPIGA